MTSSIPSTTDDGRLGEKRERRSSQRRLRAFALPSLSLFSPSLPFPSRPTPPSFFFEPNRQRAGSNHASALTVHPAPRHGTKDTPKARPQAHPALFQTDQTCLLDFKRTKPNTRGRDRDTPPGPKTDRETDKTKRQEGRREQGQRPNRNAKSRSKSARPFLFSTLI